MNIYKVKVSRVLISAFIFAQVSSAQIAGLSGWNVFLDPGHSKKENMGIYNYSEAEKVLRIGLALKEMLLTETDIDTVYICRSNDQQSVSLGQRTDYANSLGAAWYHSIHSNAGGSGQNNVLLLWGQYENNAEKVPNGGKAVADIMVNNLSAGMRIASIGSKGDHQFYGKCPSFRPCPYLYVNYYTNMPSELSEGGFHTNPRQNQLNMNADWKRLEARTLFWSFLDYHKIERPQIRILTGIVSNIDDNVPINGATIKMGERVYTTDTYESLFHKYSSEPDELQNGFYYFEDFETVEDSVEIIVSVQDFISDTLKIAAVDNFFTFKDVQLISTIPPYFISSSPVNDDSAFSVLDDIVINFSRPMDKESVETNLVITPEISGLRLWTNNDTQLIIRSDSVAVSTDYNITLSGNAEDNFGHKLDANNDGIEGDPLIINFRTEHDVYGPELVKYSPIMNSADHERKPLIRLEFDELLDSESLTTEVLKLERFSDNSFVDINIQSNQIDKKQIVHVVPESDLYPEEIYVMRVFPGIEDLLGNESTKTVGITFITGDYDYEITGIDNFDNGIGNWWAPDASGTTTGTKSGTGVGSDSTVINPVTEGSGSMRISYEWDLGSDTWMIREYLGGGDPRTVYFDSNYIMQAYVFGDDSGNKFRFAVDDNQPSSSSADHEVSPWFSLDWMGWKLISWDLSKGEIGTWLGDGLLDGSMRFDSFQLTYTAGAQDTGTIYFDDLRLVKKVEATGIENADTDKQPDNYYLGQNFPNPFNPETEFKFGIPAQARVQIQVYNLLGQMVANLLDEIKPAGNYSFRFDGSSLSSGIYLYKIKAGSFVETRKMFLIK